MLVSASKRGLWTIALVLLQLFVIPDALATGTHKAKISLDKRVTAFEQHPDGTCRIEFQLKVKNRGSDKLVDVQIYDHVAKHVAPGQVINIDHVTSDVFEVNTHFDGIAQKRLLSSGQFLKPGKRGKVNFRLTLQPAAGKSDYVNKADVVGTSTRTHKQVKDWAKTHFHCPPPPDPQLPQIGSAKQFRDLTLVGIDSYEVTVRSVVENLSNDLLASVQLQDDLMQAFPDVSSIQIVAPPQVIAGAPLTPNNNYNGQGDVNLLTGTDDLAPGARSVLEFRLAVTLADSLGPFSNQIVALATAPSGETVSDPSDDGEETDPNGNGIADEAGENDPSVIQFPPFAVGLAKALTSISALGNDRYAAEFSLLVENLSSLAAPNVQVSDDLLSGLAPVQNLSITELTVSGGLSEVAPDFDGIGQVDLLGGNETLVPDAQANINLRVEFATTDRSIRLNQAFVRSVGDVGNLLTEDASDDGTDPDPNGNGNPSDPGEDDPTPIELPEQPAPPVIGLANELSNLVEIAPGQFQAEFILRVENLGDVIAPGVQIVDDFASTFASLPSVPPLAPFEVIDVSVSGDLSELNSSFDGTSDTELLSGSESLPVGGRAEIVVQVNFTPGIELGPFSNQPVVTSSDNGGVIASDPADDGAIVDSDGDGNANEAGENDPTVFSLPPVQIGAAKSLTASVPQPGGATDLTFTFVIENLSPSRSARFVQLNDDLSDSFPGASLTLISPVVVTGGLSLANADFDGDGDTRLLAGSETLAAGESAAVEFTVRVAGVSGDFLNQAEVTAAESEDGEPVSRDLSDDGADPDPNGNGDPGDANEDDPTPINLPAAAPVSIGAANAVTGITQTGPSNYQVELTITLTNLGATTASNVQLNNPLATTFANIPNFSVAAVAISGALNQLNPAFDGDGETNLLSGLESLAPGASAQIVLTLDIDAGTELGPFVNQVTATSSDGDRVLAEDLSDDGLVVDSDGDGNANEDGENDPTIFSLMPVSIGVAKALSSVTPVEDQVFDVAFSLALENLSATQPASFIQLTDNLAEAFPGADLSIVAPPVVSGDLSLGNASFDGRADTNLLSGTENLAVGGAAQVVFTVRVAGVTGTFTNQARMTAALSEGGQPIAQDLSDDGINPDSNDNGRANDPGEDDPTPVTLSSEPDPEDTSILGLAKSAGMAVANDDGTFTIPFTFRVANVGDTSLTGLQIVDDFAATFPPPSEFTVADAPTSDTLSVNPAFNGRDDVQLLQGSDTLAAGAVATVSVEVVLTPNGQTQFSNSATASARDPNDDPVEDVSTDGTEVDPDNDGDPTNNNDPTPVVVPGDDGNVGVIGIAKTTLNASVVGQGEIEATFSLLVENLGAAPLSDVQITEDLTQAFPSPAQVSVVTPPTIEGALSELNPAFDGTSQTTLLSGSESLAPGETATLVFTIRVALNDATGPFSNQVVAVGMNPGGDPSEDLSDDGVDPDPNGDGDPGGPNEDDPTVVDFPAALTGTVFEDVNVDSQFDAGDLPLGGWIVELLDLDGNVISTTTSGTDGTYAFMDLPPGSYSVRFVNPESDAVWGARPATLIAATTTRVDFPVVPGGRFYNSATREPVAGVEVALVDNFGQPLDNSCLLPGQQNQVVGDSGAYRFDVLPGSHPTCPTSLTNYRLAIVSTPAAFQTRPSTVLPVSAEALVVANCAIDPNPEPPCVVQAQTTPPMGSQDTTYFLQWTLAEGDPRVTNNHIPLDAVDVRSLTVVSVVKRAEQNTAVQGDLVGYEVLVTNPVNSDTPPIEILDNVPAGFQFVPGTQSLRLPGADNVLDTLDDVVTPLETSGVDPTVMGPFVVPGATTVAVRYLVRVSTGVTRGEYVNTVTPILGGTPVGEPSSASVEVVGDPIFEQTTIIGKVFNDANRNGRQDPEESGLPGVRLATVSGLLIETDRYGRYHIADVDVPRAERGANFILKLDTATLPRGAEVISENPRVIRITQALMSKINFAVHLSSQEPIVEEQPRYKVVRTTTQFADEYIEPVRFASGQSDIPQSYLRTLDELLERYRDKQNLRVRFTGHTDNQPLSPRAAQKYGDNQGLSEARAREVAEFVIQELELDPQVVEIIGRADRESVASNATLDGMRLNRRVEIEILFDSAVREESVVEGELNPALAGAAASTTRERFTSSMERIEPVRFGSGQIEMSAGAQRELDRSLANFGSVEVQALSVVGHADASPYAGADSENGDDGNDTLSRQRAEGVAAYISQRLGIPASAVTIAAKGAAEPVADNTTVAGRDLNRRVEVSLTVRRKSSQVETTYTAITPVRTERWVETPQGGRLWMSEDALLLKPRLDVMALTELVVDSQGRMLDAVPFAAHGNYGALVERYQLDIYDARDTDYLRPLASLQAERLDFPVAFEWLDDEPTFRPGQRLTYVLRAQAGGTEDATHARTLQVVRDTKPTLLRVDPATIWSQNNLDAQRINLRGSRIRVHGADFAPGSTVNVADTDVPVANDGRFVYEFYAQPGTHALPVSGRSTLPGENGSDGFWRTTLNPEVDDDYAFIIGLANLTVGDHSLSGDFEPLGVDDHFDESVYVDGRLAFYAKAKIKGKYLITAQLDSIEDELKNFTDNLKREDPRRLFRQLDPDRYYPVYGDDSTTVSDVDSQGAFYVRVDWDRNQALWGNYSTGMTDTEYLQYNRSLYGAMLSHKSNANTRFGDAARSVTLFGSEAQSAAAHVTFRATGGSLYYLKHTDVVEGSEKVWVEVRQRDTQQVVERQDFIEGRDYEVDALQGRIILRHPLSQVVNDRGPAIVRSSALEGDDVYLLVDYEYVPDDFTAEEATYGGRAKVWLGDYVGVGVSKVIDERDGTDFDLEGIDITLKASNGTYLSAEIAQSEARQNNANFESLDGGLSFSSQNSVIPDALTDGDALALEGRVNLQDLSDNVRGDVRAWHKERDAGFSAGRLRQGTEVTEQGADVVVQPSDTVRITAGYAELEEEGFSRSEVARLQADVKLGRVTVGGEIRHEDLQRTVGAPGSTGTTRQQGDGLLAGVRVGYHLNETQTVYASAQTGLNEDGEYRDNDLYAVGLNTQLNDHAAISIEAADGDRGHALTGGFEYSPAEQLTLNMQGGVGPGAISQFSGNYRLAEGHELYGSYAVDPDRTFGEHNLLTLGQRRDFGNRFGIFTESQFGKDDQYAGASHAFGVDYTTDQDWVLTALLQTAEDEQGVGDIERNAVSFGAAVKRDDYKVSAKVEFREDKSATRESDQFLLSSSYTRIASPARRWIGQLNLSWTDDELNGGKTARFVEFDIGHAYRPVDNDRWNLLTKYGYFYDLVSAGQSASRPDQRVHILSAEALYELSARWEIGGKLAVKEGEVRMFRDSGSWEAYGLGLAVVRGRYHVTKAWDALAEYRYLRDRHGDNHRHGALLGVYRHVGDHFKVGLGYNFTDFSDDIRDAEYDNHGWFVDLIGKF